MKQFQDPKIDRPGQAIRNQDMLPEKRLLNQGIYGEPLFLSFDRKNNQKKTYLAFNELNVAFAERKFK